MTTRLIIAYSIIAVMVLAAAAAVWWGVYNSRERTDARRQARIAKRDQERNAARMSGAGDRG